ncbi:MAG: hypothetical protein LBR23_07370 [Spirochaetaceae bacterium]|jgi:hypothetical protein|nr:hypothetical protein [Spirochaetaceae bacterium]
MRTKNTIEEDLDAIRDKIYEKTKDMSMEDLRKYYDSRMQEAQKICGFSFREAEPEKLTQEAMRG